MRKYKSDGSLDRVLCNCCGKRLIVEQSIIREGNMSVSFNWDFFSEKDGEIHRFDICEECYDEWTGQFCVPIEVEEQTELL